MASVSGPRVRSELRAGVTTLGAITAFALACLFGPSLLAPAKRIYRMEANSQDDLTGLRAGSPVLFGGVLRGSVLRVRDVSGPNGEVEYLVDLEIAPDPPIYPGATARIITEPVSQRARIEFLGIGRRGATGDPLADGQLIRHARADGGIEDMLGSKLETSLSDLGRRLSEFADAMPRFAAGKSRFDAVRDEAAALRAAVVDDLPRLRERITETAERFRAIADEVEALREAIAGARGAYDAFAAGFGEEGAWPRILERARSAMASWEATAETRTAIAASFGELRGLVARVRDAIASMRGRFAALVADFGADLGFGEIRANVSLAATNFVALRSAAYANPFSVLIPNEGDADRRCDRLDDLDRDLLSAIADARSAERALRDLEAVVATGEVGGERIDRLLEALGAIDAIEEALAPGRFSGRRR